MKKTSRKLQLNAQTVRVLDGGEMNQIVGGIVTTAMTCTNNTLYQCPKTSKCPQTTWMTCA